MSNIITKVNQSFKFQGFEITYARLKAMTRVKAYIESSHRDRLLLKDEQTGMMFLYDFDEFVTFDSRGDIMNELYIKVESENDAETIAMANTSMIKRIPFIHVNPEFEIHIYE